MGNESSALVKLRRGSKDKQPPMIMGYDESVASPMYRKKKTPRSLSHGRYSNDTRQASPPKWQLEVDTVSIRSQRGSFQRGHLNASSDSSGSADPFLLTPTPDRKRSRSICPSQLALEPQLVRTAATKMNDDTRGAAFAVNGGSGSRKMSTTTGLVPSLNRLRIQHSFKTAKPCIGEAILKRAISNRPEMRSFLNRLSEQQVEHMSKQFYSLIADSVEHMERPEVVQQHARAFGETYAALYQLGFRPDYFAPLADAAIAECVKLDGGAHKRCETLLAWSQLIGAIFTSVRDGYYSRVRYQRRSSLPQGVISKQLSIDFSKSVDQAAYIH